MAPASAALLPCHKPGRLEAGVDEAGRGCLAGPVVAAAVVWDPELRLPPEQARLIRDSKTLSRAQRDRARELVEEHAVAWSVCGQPAAEIDRVNVLRATYAAMHGALDGLGVEVDAVLVDGDRFRAYISPATGAFALLGTAESIRGRERPLFRVFHAWLCTSPDAPFDCAFPQSAGEMVPHACVVDGDKTFLAIAAASILAKTHRDALMRAPGMAGAHPEYGWDRNVGYGTPEHLDALRRLGPCEHHRMSFAPVAAAAPSAAPAPAST